MFEEIKEIIVEELGVDEDKVVETATFNEDLGADSLDLFELVMAFEDKFDVKIPEEDLEKIKKDTIKVTFSWQDDEKYNDLDSRIGSSLEEIEIPISIKFSQYKE